MAEDTLLDLTTLIVANHVSNNNVAVGDLPGLIQSVHGALKGLGRPVEEPQEELKPAVSIRSSVKPDYIVCLEDGKKLKMLKRHLMTHYDLTPDQYRTKWNLPSDYPMVAPSYAEQRKQLAMKIGLGRKPVVAAAAAAPAKAAAKAPVKAPAKAPAKTGAKSRAKKVTE